MSQMTKVQWHANTHHKYDEAALGLEVWACCINQTDGSNYYKMPLFRKTETLRTTKPAAFHVLCQDPQNKVKHSLLSKRKAF